MAGAFDRIAHDHILTMLGSFPARGMIRQWLKAGVVEQGRLSRTEEGTPQGGVVSPVLLNVALHGMEQAAGVRYYTTGRAAGWTVAGSPVLITYAGGCSRCPVLRVRGVVRDGGAREGAARRGEVSRRRSTSGIDGRWEGLNAKPSARTFLLVIVALTAANPLGGLAGRVQR